MDDALFRISATNLNDIPVVVVSLGVLLVATCAQSLVLVEVGGLSLKLSHALLPLFALCVASATCGFRIPPWPVNALFGLFAISTFQSAITYGVSGVAANYLYAYVLLVCCYNAMRTAGLRSCMCAARAAAVVVLAIVVVKDFIYSDAIASFLAAPNGHPVMPWVFGGGANLEATWLAMFAVFFHGRRSGWAYLACVTLVSAVYASRAAFIACMLAGLYLLWPGSGQLRRYARRLALVAVLGLAMLTIAVETDSYLTERFASVGDDPGSLGRFAMWQYVPDALRQSPLLGYGAGNTLDVIRAMSGVQFREGNIHNYYLQVLLDFGVPGFAAFGMAVICFLRGFAHGQASNPFAAFLVIYLMLAVVQFRGGEPFVAFALAGVCAFWGKFSNRQDIDDDSKLSIRPQFLIGKKHIVSVRQERHVSFRSDLVTRKAGHA